MPDFNVATGKDSFDTTGLEDALFGPDDQKGASETEVEKVKKPENDSDEPTENNESGDTESVASEEEETSEESADESVEESSEDGTKTYRVGNQIFATAEDAIAEATRIIGRNAQLAGDLRAKEASLTTLQSQLEEAIQANKQWQEWAAAQENGENIPSPATPTIDPAKIADEVTRKIEAREVARREQESVRAEVEKIIALPNFRQVSGIVETLADKTNPLTGRIYTPAEAYDFAAMHLGVKNLRTAPAAAPVVTKKIDRTAVKSAAARPGSQRMADAPKEKSAPSFSDEMLSQQLL